MSDQPKVHDEERRLTDKPFSEMSAGEKASFLGKVLIFLVSGGFIYPGVWVE